MEMELEKKRMAPELMRQIILRKKNYKAYLVKQSEEFDRHLASKCILSGIPPPMWLRSSRPPLPPSDVRRFDVGKDRLSVSPPNPLNDSCIDSPKDRDEVIIPKSCVRRSKSRQKALEIRNSSRANKHCSLDSQDVLTSDNLLDVRTTMHSVKPCELKFSDPVVERDDIYRDDKDHMCEYSGVEHPDDGMASLLDMRQKIAFHRDLSPNSEKLNSVLVSGNMVNQSSSPGSTVNHPDMDRASCEAENTSCMNSCINNTSVTENFESGPQYVQLPNHSHELLELEIRAYASCIQRGNECPVDDSSRDESLHQDQLKRASVDRNDGQQSTSSSFKNDSFQHVLKIPEREKDASINTTHSDTYVGSSSDTLHYEVRQCHEIPLRGDENTSTSRCGQAESPNFSLRNSLPEVDCGLEEVINMHDCVDVLGEQKAADNDDECENICKNIDSPCHESTDHQNLDVSLKHLSAEGVFVLEEKPRAPDYDLKAGASGVVLFDEQACNIDELGNLPNDLDRPSNEVMHDEGGNLDVSLIDPLAEGDCVSEGGNLDVSLSNPFLECSGLILCEQEAGGDDDENEEVFQDLASPIHESMDVPTFNDTVDKSEPDMVGYKFRFGSAHSPVEGMVPSQSVTEFEGFVMEIDNELNDKLDLPNVLYRAGVVERLCKSASTNTPISEFSTSYDIRNQLNLQLSYATRCPDSTPSMEPLDIVNSSKRRKTNYSLLTEKMTSELSAIPIADQYSCDLKPTLEGKKIYSSPVRKVWDGVISKSGSSGKYTNSTSELPCISEEIEDSNEVPDILDGGNELLKVDDSAKRVLFDINGNMNFSASVPGEDVGSNRTSITGLSLKESATYNKNIEKTNGVENENNKMSIASSDICKSRNTVKGTLRKNKLSHKVELKKENSRHSNLEQSKRTNIVSGVTSFIPLVRQKQPQAIVSGKREVKIKALEAAEAAKRLAEKVENERKMKKEALKLAREQREALKKHEVEDRGARKRLREEEERKEAQQGRKRVDKPLKKHDERNSEKKMSRHVFGDSKKTARTDKRLDTMSEFPTSSDPIQTIEASEPVRSFDNNGDLHLHGYNVPVPSRANDITSCMTLPVDEHKDPSYIISPYKESDDECDDDGDNDITMSKFVPRWARNDAVAIAILSQKNISPESVLPPRRSSSLHEVFRPRK